MSDQDITIGLTTTADTSGADETQKALQDTGASVDDLRSKEEQQNRQQEEAAKSAENNAAGLKKIETAARTLVAVQMVEGLKQTSAALREATQEGGLLHDALGDITPALDQVDNALDTFSTGLTTAVSTGNSYLGLLAALGSSLVNVAKAYEKLEDARYALEESERGAMEHTVFLEKQRLFYKENAAQISSVEEIGEENAALLQQESNLKRLIDLKRELAGQADTAARQEVQIAKLTGGDVALAEANLIATNLQGKLETLNNSLLESQKAAEVATAKERQANDSWMLLQKKVSDGIAKASDENVMKAKEAVDQAGAAAEVARQKFADELQKSEGERLNILRAAEISARQKEEELVGSISAPAQKSFDAIYSDLQSLVETQQPKISSRISEIRQAVDNEAESARSAANEAFASIKILGESTGLSEMAKELQRASSTREANDKLLMEAVKGLIQSTETMRSMLPGVFADARQLRADVEALRNMPR